MRYEGIRSTRENHRTVGTMMVCCTAEASFGCVYDVVVVMGGGGGVVLVRVLCVYEIE